MTNHVSLLILRKCPSTRGAAKNEKKRGNMGKQLEWQQGLVKV